MTAHIPGRSLRPAELIRLQRGLTQRAVAASAGMTESSLYHIEHGRRWPGPDAIARLAVALGVPPEELVVALLRGWMIEHRPARSKGSGAPGQPQGGQPQGLPLRR